MFEKMKLKELAARLDGDLFVDVYLVRGEDPAAEGPDGANRDKTVLVYEGQAVDIWDWASREAYSREDVIYITIRQREDTVDPVLAVYI